MEHCYTHPLGKGAGHRNLKLPGFLPVARVQVEKHMPLVHEWQHTAVASPGSHEVSWYLGH